MKRGAVVRWRVVPDGDGHVALDVQLVGEVVTEHVRIRFSAEGAERLSEDLRACAAGQGSAEPTAQRRDLEARH